MHKSKLSPARSGDPLELMLPQLCYIDAFTNEDPIMLSMLRRLTFAFAQTRYDVGLQSHPSPARYIIFIHLGPQRYIYPRSQRKGSSS